MRVLFVFMMILGSYSLWAAPQAEKKNKEKKLSKDISFDEVLIRGKHHFSDEAVITVEKDKVLDALLVVRKDFKDRILKSSKRN